MPNNRISNNSYDSGVVDDIIQTEYKMCHKYRGRALIFNNEHFDSPELRSRDGTHLDCDRLSSVLKYLRFQVKEYSDLCKSSILRKINRAATRDHTENDCILIAILSHGKMGYIHARDTYYSLESIWRPFTSDNCPTLAGKPKIFIIQACQGDLKDPGYPGAPQDELGESENCSYVNCRVPTHEDFLIAFSTIPGYSSWRNTVDGSWFIQSLCEVLRTHGWDLNILTLLTFVAQRVAVNFESYDPFRLTMHQKKQITCTMSTLTRILYFRNNDTLDEECTN